MQTKLHILKAYHGDCLLIRTFNLDEQPFTILIDGGPSTTFNFALRNALKDDCVIDLMILTHIDSDHIGGLISFAENSRFAEMDIKKIWVNCANLVPIGPNGELITYGQGVVLEKWLIDRNVPKHIFSERVTTNMRNECSNGICFEILSPTPAILNAVTENWPELSQEYKDKMAALPITNDAPSQIKKGTMTDLAKIAFRASSSVSSDLFNAMSIAFVLRTPDLSILLLADSRPEVIKESLVALGYNETHNRLKVDYVKVSHHGSKNNTSIEVLDMVESYNFIFSTNGGSGRSKHPDRETIARLLYHPKRDLNKRIKLYFNYPLSEITATSGLLFTAEELKMANAEYFDDICLVP
ncbi:ComEC/Rec2 family competence protein [Pedobacter yonginense]|uniref:ComEC/Rec2 family competence protein n=1 Tax=Pedobacter yonginense TaxID=651869 RepID=UPI0014039870|nr:MBL fold metallo-hydrolase [Pedobacter yonginense]